MKDLKLLIGRHRSKSFIMQKMSELKAEWNKNDDLAKRDHLSLEQLRAMQIVTKMKEQASKSNQPFVAGFIAPDGSRFITSNVEGETMQEALIEAKLDELQNNGDY